MLQSTQIKENYPKTYKELVAFGKAMLDKTIDRMIQVGEEKPELTDEMLEGFTNSVLSINPRSLYDFFDQRDIKICVMPHTDTDDLWLYYNNKLKHSSSTDSRIDAEEKAFLEAFEYYEKNN